MPTNSAGDLLAEHPGAVAEVLLNRVRTAIEADPASAELNEVYVLSGDLAWDECCGTLVAAPIQTYRSVTFPVPVTNATSCEGSELVVDIAVILLRCMPTIDANGIPPTPEETQTASIAVDRDAATIYNVLSGELPGGWERANLTQTFSGAQGGCIAVDTRLTIGLPQSFWCIPEPDPVP